MAEGAASTPCEHAGIEAVRQAALTAAVSIENRDDASHIRQQAAAAALQGLAEGARALTLTDPSPPCSSPCSEGT